MTMPMTAQQPQTTNVQQSEDQITQQRANALNSGYYQDPLWKQQAGMLAQQQAKTAAQPVGTPQAATAVSQDAYTNQLNQINNTGQIQNAAVQGAQATAQARTSQIQLQQWQAQQQQAYSDLQIQFQQSAKGIITQPNTTANATANSNPGTGADSIVGLTGHALAVALNNRQHGLNADGSSKPVQFNATDPDSTAGLTGHALLVAQNNQRHGLNANGTVKNDGAVSVQAGDQTIQLHPGQWQMANSTDNQVAQWAREAGFSEDAIPMIVGIAKQESTENPLAVNTKNSNGTEDFGLMQINSSHADLLAKYNWRDPVENLKMAFQISNGGQNWEPWVSFQTGDAQKFVSQLGAKKVTAATSVDGVIVNQPATVKANGVSALRANLVGTAMKYLGTPYVFAGDSLTQGIDCSGLVHEVYKLLGIASPRTADADSHPDQWQAEGAYGGNTQVKGTRTDIKNLKPGDLVCWQGGWRGPDLVGHVAIYAGNNQIIEAPETGLNVRRRTLRASEVDVDKGGSLIGIHLNLPGD